MLPVRLCPLPAESVELKKAITCETIDTKVNSSSERLISQDQEIVQYTNNTKKVQVYLAISHISSNICSREFAGACNSWNGDAAFLGKLSITLLASLARKLRSGSGGFQFVEIHC